jgi:hypothetical protein
MTPDPSEVEAVGPVAVRLTAGGRTVLQADRHVLLEAGEVDPPRLSEADVSGAAPVPTVGIAAGVLRYE